MQIDFLTSEAHTDRAVKVINAAYDEGEAGMWVPEYKRTTPDEVNALIAKRELVACFVDGELKGCVRTQEIQPGVGEFAMLAVEASSRHLSIGRKLIEFAEATYAARGCKIMQLEMLVPKTWKHPNKEHLKSWYAKLGYKVVRQGNFGEYYPQLLPVLATDCDFLIFEKPLADATTK